MNSAQTADLLGKRLTALAVLSVTAVLLFVLHRFDPTQHGEYFPQCPLYKTTGLQCGGCGLTRATHAFLHGDIISAVKFNAFFPIFLAIGVWLLFALLRWAWNGKTPDMKFLTVPRAVAFGIALIIFSVVRNLW